VVWGELIRKCLIAKGAELESDVSFAVWLEKKLEQLLLSHVVILMSISFHRH
jgi:hypothetical protein